MKIVCESCGAKYSIADEKVAGKAFKIRCKKCSSVIVVRSQEAAAEEGATRVVEQPTEPDQIWHVVVNGDQQGPFTPAQIGEMLTTHMIDWEAFVWKDGFDNWLPARDVEELVNAVMGGGGEEAAPQSTDEAAYEYSGEVAQSDAFGDLPGSQPEEDDGFGQQATMAASRAEFGAAGADLFANADAGGTPFDAAGHEEEDVVASGGGAQRMSSPRVEVAPGMTGARNENSVLFSLSNLQALATGPSGSPAGAPAPAPKAGMASGEGSGLIDIRALASSVQATSGSSAKKDSVDDLLSIGGGSAPFAPTLGAPILAPVKPERDSKPLIIGAIAGVLVIGAIAAAAVFYLKSKDTDAANNQRIAQLDAARISAERRADTRQGQTPIAGGAGASPANSNTQAQGGSNAGAAANADDANDDSPSTGGGSRRNNARRNQRGGGSRGNDTAAAPAAAPAAGGGGPTPSRTGGGGGGSIDDMLDNALRGSGGRTPAPRAEAAPAAADPSLPDRPDASAVRSAIGAVQPAVSACAQGQHGLATTSITVSGSTGRVSNATVSGQFSGTPQGTCVARAVRGARFPRFRQAAFTISYPFRL
ncbi:MAG: zinc-ribbon domain-containing protein [Sandaracinaceae bacterium]|jgi:predicted Zn finger-like uncharacterized protein|nr:zinc-ribbon domain-containing protein [Sandaracinaceae bacterium]